jgi:LacI family transcriptional regulator
LERRVDGILLVPASSSAAPVERLQRQNLPVVVLDRRVCSAQVDVVRGDSHDGAYQLVRHLLSLGHRRVAVLSGPKDVSTAEDRVVGYCRALEEAGLAIRADWVRYGKFSQESGYEMTQQVLATLPRPTALFAVNNFIAVGALRALRNAELSVPEDMALVSFDDLTSELVVEPFLTVADQPAYEMGQRATELLLTRLSESALDGYQEIVLPTKIVVRKSSGLPIHKRVA